jgi:hypothetical protein
MTDRRRPQSGALIVLTVGFTIVLLAILGEWPAGIRLPLVLLWLLIVPGWPWARRARVGDIVDTFIVGIGLSAAMLTIVAAAMAVTGVWMPAAAFLVLSAAGVVGALAPQRSARDAPGAADRSPGRPRTRRESEAPDG